MGSQQDAGAEPQPARIGQYRVLESIGSGGMGHVYRAHDEQHDRPVAIKLLAAQLATDHNSVQRFHREIQVLQRLDHPNIVHLIDVGEQNGLPFFVMEYVDGASLTTLIKRLGRVPWRQAVDWAIQICDALEHAHGRGVIHRDLKPGNVLIGLDGRVKLTDFGIARLFGTVTLTSAGNVVGTAEYMSPEQAAGKRVGPRSDLYSLGVLLYTMVTGTPPFRGKNYLDVLQKHRYGRFDRPKQLVPEIPIWLDELICELLEKDPQQRPDSAVAVRRRLEAVLRKQELRERDTRYLVHPADEEGGELDSGETMIMATRHEPGDTPPEVRPTAMMRLFRIGGHDDRPIERTRRIIARALLVVLVVLFGFVGYRLWRQAVDPEYRWQRLRARAEQLEEGNLPLLLPQVRDYLKRFPDSAHAGEAAQLLADLELRLRRRQLLRSPFIRSLRPTGQPLSAAEERYVAALIKRWTEGRDAALRLLDELLAGVDGRRKITTVEQMAAEDYVALMLEKIALLRRAGHHQEAAELETDLRRRFSQFPSRRIRALLGRDLGEQSSSSGAKPR